MIWLRVAGRATKRFMASHHNWHTDQRRLRRIRTCYTVYVARETLTVRVEPRVRKELDGIAAALERDRSHVVNEALKAYIDIHQWQIDHIRQGLREADAGKFASDREVKRVIAALRRK